MSIEFRAVKKLGALRPASAHDAEIMQGLPDGAPIKMVATIHPRNERAHRWFFGLLGVVADNTDLNTTQLLTLIKIGIGHVDTIIMPGTGEVIYQPRSISWAKMDEKEFRSFVDRAINFIIERILPGTDSTELEREVFERLGISLDNINPRSEAAGARAGTKAAGGGEDAPVRPLPSVAQGGRR